MTANGTHPWNAHAAIAGFAPKSDERMAKSARAGQQVAARLIRESERNPSQKAIELDDPLPDDLLSAALDKLWFHLRVGHWEQAKAVIDAARQEATLRQQEATPLPSLPLGQRLALTVERLGLDRRTCELCERMGIGTAGSLLEDFPWQFIELPNVGARTVEQIASVLLRAGLLDAAEAQRRLEAWQAGMDASRQIVKPTRRVSGYGNTNRAV